MLLLPISSDKRERKEYNMRIFDKRKSGRLVLASMMAFGVATMLNISVGDAAKQVKPDVIAVAPIIDRTPQNIEGWVVLDRWNNNQPDTSYYHIHGVPGDNDYSVALSYNGTYAMFSIPPTFEKEEGISLVKDGDNLYIEYKDPADKKQLQAPKRLWLGKFFKYDRRQGGQQPRGYFVSANELEDRDFTEAGMDAVVYYDGILGEYLHKETIESEEKSPEKIQPEKVSEEMGGTSVSTSTDATVSETENNSHATGHSVGASDNIG